VLQEEHVVPVSKHGTYTPDNIIPACQTCNISKKNLALSEWLKRKFGKRRTKQILVRINAYFDSLKETSE